MEHTIHKPSINISDTDYNNIIKSYNNIGINISKVNHIDYKLTKAIVDLCNNDLIQNIIRFGGIYPFEVYVIPGMYISIILLILTGSPGPLQFHLLPHFFAYIYASKIKMAVTRPRPGCYFKDIDITEPGHCKGTKHIQSWPSGHTCVVYALLSALLMELYYSEKPTVFEINIKNKTNRNIIAAIGCCIAILTSLHRVSEGFHSVFDVISGIFIGISLGFISWTSIEYYKKKYNKLCKDDHNKKKPICKETTYNNNLEFWFDNYSLYIFKPFSNNKYTIILLGRIILTLITSYLLYIFIKHDLEHLLTLTH